MEAEDIRSLQLVHSSECISIFGSDGFRNDSLGQENLEGLFHCCLKGDIQKKLTDFIQERRIDLESRDVSIFCFEMLNDLLLSESISVESEDALLRFILKQCPDYLNLLNLIRVEFLSEDGFSLLEEHFPPESLWQRSVEWMTHPINSQIISNFPEIFTEFRRKHFELLWRGSRDGFEAKEFHRRCDGHANTVTVILDTNGNIFGGFTPVEWESRTSVPFPKQDESQNTFIFTLKNPHNIPARKFLMIDKRTWAIYSESRYGPSFSYDMLVSNDCNANTQSHIRLGCHSYINDTGLDGNIVLTGSHHFQVKEIEVFEITN
jgi:hypothetical protein